MLCEPPRASHDTLTPGILRWVAHADLISLRRRARVAREVLLVPSERRLIGRMLVWRLIVATLKHVVPIRRLVALAGGRRKRADLPSQERIVELARLACHPRLVRSRDNCLDRSLVAYRYLRAGGSNPSLVIGFMKDDHAVTGHAWLTIDDQAVGEPQAAHADFSELLRFAGDGPVLGADEA